VLENEGRSGERIGRMGRLDYDKKELKRVKGKNFEKTRCFESSSSIPEARTPRGGL